MNKRDLSIELAAIGEIFKIAGEEQFILDSIRTVSETDIRWVMEPLNDDELDAYLAYFTSLEEYEWCRLINLVVQERKLNK